MNAPTNGSPATSDTPLPLEGLRVLDAASLLAGPLVCTNLGDFGADVVKVEHPRGDDLRRWGLEKDGVPLFWKSVSRNKRAITLDFHEEEDRETLKRLAEHADVLVENFRPGRLESWGLGPEEMHRVNPGLVYVRMTGFGQTGPLASQPGFGTLAEAYSGFAHITGDADGPPTLPAFGMADSIAAQVATWAVMMALYWRDVRGGEGQVIDVSLFEPLFSILGPQLAEYQHGGVVEKRRGNRADRTSPRNAYQTADDRWVALSGGTQQIADRILRAIGREDLVGDPRFNSSAARQANGLELDGIIAEWIRARPLEEVLRGFAEVHAPLAPVNDISQIHADEHYRAREAFVAAPDPDLGTVEMAAPAPRLSLTPGRIRWTGAKDVGVDNELVKRELDSRHGAARP